MLHRFPWCSSFYWYRFDRILKKFRIGRPLCVKNKFPGDVQNSSSAWKFFLAPELLYFAKPWDIKLKPVPLQSYIIPEPNNRKAAPALDWLGPEMSLNKRKFLHDFSEFAWSLKQTCWPSQARAGAVFAVIRFSDDVALQRDRFELNVLWFCKVWEIHELGNSSWRWTVLDIALNFIFTANALTIRNFFKTPWDRNQSNEMHQGKRWIT